MQNKSDWYFSKKLLDVSKRNHIRLAIKADKSAFILLSAKPAKSINQNNYFKFIELLIGGWLNTKSIIRVGNMESSNGATNTPNILKPHSFIHIWVSWDNNFIRVGRGFIIHENVFMARRYPGSINVKYLALFKGYGSGGKFELYPGKGCSIWDRGGGGVGAKN